MTKELHLKISLNDSKPLSSKEIANLIRLIGCDIEQHHMSGRLYNKGVDQYDAWALEVIEKE